jgi:hypothetical protein
VEVEESEPGFAKGGRLGETVEETVEEIQVRFEDAMNAVRQNAQVIIGKVRGLADPPDELEVTFGLKAAGELGNFAVAKASAEANYTVKMTWKRAEDQKTG